MDFLEPEVRIGHQTGICSDRLQLSMIADKKYRNAKGKQVAQNYVINHAGLIDHVEFDAIEVCPPLESNHPRSVFEGNVNEGVNRLRFDSFAAKVVSRFATEGRCCGAGPRFNHVGQNCRLSRPRETSKSE